MRLMITGDGTLATAAREACGRYFELTTHEPALLWVCHDTPLGEDDRPQVAELLKRIDRELSYDVAVDVPVLVSSQIPVGTIRELERHYRPGRFFAYAPENIRVKTALEDFVDQARVVVGRRGRQFDELFLELFAPFTRRVIFTDPETAEMAKHALNCYLGLSIAWINEIASLCELVGADASVISEALRSEPRVSPKAPLRPGAPFGGGHLARDIFVLEKLAREGGVDAPITTNIRRSNGTASIKRSLKRTPRPAGVLEAVFAKVGGL